MRSQGVSNKGGVDGFLPTELKYEDGFLNGNFRMLVVDCGGCL